MDARLRKSILAVCDRGLGGVPVLPERKELLARLAQARDDHAVQALGAWLRGAGTIEGVAKVVGALLQAQNNELARTRVSRVRPGRGSDSLAHRLMARLEADELTAYGTKLRYYKSKRKRKFDEDDRLESAAEMAEALPQGT